MNLPYWPNQARRAYHFFCLKTWPIWVEKCIDLYKKNLNVTKAIDELIFGELSAFLIGTKGFRKIRYFTFPFKRLQFILCSFNRFYVSNVESNVEKRVKREIEEAVYWTEPFLLSRVRKSSRAHDDEFWFKEESKGKFDLNLNFIL